MYEIDKSIGMHKWPHMTVIGDRVSEAEAAEILIRTDSNDHSFGWAGNQSEHTRRDYARAVGCACTRDTPWRDRVKCPANARKLDTLEYLKNSRIVSAYVGGPHGWCDWSGNVFANSYNVGKWPSEECLLEEAASLAAAFPFLSARFWFWSAEGCEFDGLQRPVFCVRVFCGAADECQDACPLAPRQLDVTSVGFFLSRGLGREIGIRPDQLAEKVRALDVARCQP